MDKNIKEKYLVTGIVQGASGMVLFQKEIYCEGKRSSQLIDKLYDIAEKRSCYFS